jgi:hypothetical protein
MNTLQKTAYWAPRVFGILLTIFITLFALDVQYTGDATAFVTELASHLIPTAVLLIILIAAWRWEMVGVVAYSTLAIFYISLTLNHPDWVVAISGPLFVAALLFGISWMNRKRRTAH